MRLVTQIRMTVFVLLILSISSTFLSVWSFQQARIQTKRVDLAHQVHQSLLSLKANTYKLFKEYGDDLINDETDDRTTEAEVIRAIRANIASARQGIAAEIQLVGTEEIEELQELNEIEEMVQVLLVTLESAVDSRDETSFSSTWAALTQVLDGASGRQFVDEVREAIEEEAAEVAEVREQAARRTDLLQTLTIILAAVILGCALTSIMILNRRFTKPVAALVSGVTKFGDGNLYHRIGLTGKDEIAQISRVFDSMADRVAEQTEALTSEKYALEEKVAKRTRQLEALLADLKKAEANRKRMIADVSHELRTPLTIIKGEAEIVLRGQEKDLAAYREALVRTRDAANHTARLVDDLLFVARTESGEVRLKVEDVDLGQILTDVLDTFAVGVRTGGAATPAHIRGDADRIRQALLVLIDNAHRHGGEIFVRLDPTPDGYRIAVEDDGPGMSDEEKAFAFERFFRGPNSAERYADGAGLGLPIALSIANAHGGTIELADRPGGGLIAALTLPAKPALKVVA